MKQGLPARSSRTSTRPTSRHSSARYAVEREPLHRRHERRRLRERIVDEFLVMLLCVEGVDGVRAVLHLDLERAEDARGGAVADDADGELAPGEVLLDEDALRKAAHEPAADGREVGRRVEPRRAVDPLAGAFGQRLGEEGVLEVHARDVRVAGNDGEARGGQARRRDEALGDGLVERRRADEGIGHRVGHVVELEKRRRLRLAAAVFDSFGDVEDEVPALPVDEPPRERLRAADAHGRKAHRDDGALERVDRLRRVELRRLLLAHAAGDVVRLQVVGETDTKRHCISSLLKRRNESARPRAR